jgi:type I restriction enzyme S subunit
MEGRENPKGSNAIELELPWPVASLDEICAISSGITKGRRPPNEPLIEVSYMAVANVQDGSLNLDLVKTIQASATEIERYRLLPGDLLLTEGGDPDKLGRGTTWNDEIIPCIHQNHIFRVRKKFPLVDMSFLSRLVASPVGKAYFLSKAKQTTGIASINLTQLRSFPVPLPPLNEQRRIAAKLDITVAAVEACRQRLDGVAAILKRFRQAVLAAAITGELTREWREQHPDDVDASSLASFLKVSHSLAGGHKRGNAAPPTDGVHDLDEQQFPEGWCLVELRDIVRPDRPITYGILKPGPELVDGVPYIRVADYRGNKLNVEGVKKTSFEIDETYSRSRLGAGDLLLSIRGTVGRLISIPPELESANITQDSARLSLQEALCPSYVKYALHSEILQSRMRRAVKGVAVRGINIGDVRALQVPIPSVQEQEEISRHVEFLLALADQLEARLTSARKIVDRLTPALLAKAFRGELVPQDPSDEPASVLLERIRAARQAEAGAGKPSRRGRRKAEANPNQIPLDAAPVPQDLLTRLLQECGSLSERALLAASELEPGRFRRQLELEMGLGAVRETRDDGQVLLEAVG